MKEILTSATFWTACAAIASTVSAIVALVVSRLPLRSETARREAIRQALQPTITAELQTLLAVFGVYGVDNLTQKMAEITAAFAKQETFRNDLFAQALPTLELAKENVVVFPPQIAAAIIETSAAMHRLRVMKTIAAKFHNDAGARAELLDAWQDAAGSCRRTLNLLFAHARPAQQRKLRDQYHRAITPPAGP